MKHAVTLLSLAASVIAPISAQAFPSLTLTESASVFRGDSVHYRVVGVPSQGFAILLDSTGGPVNFLGERIALGLTPALSPLASGILPAFGQFSGSIQAPTNSALNGISVYAQAFVADPAAPNGVFRASNGESVILHAAAQTISERFDTPFMEGYLGNFDASILGRLQGGAIRTRTHRTVDTRQGAVFGSPIETPLSPFGSRAQMVFRPRDVGSTGEEEIVTAIRWRAFGGQVVPDNFTQLSISASHSAVQPDYTVGSFSALPLFPNSGLDSTFASNVLPGETPTQLYSGGYALQARDLRPDGYVNYPAPQTSFAYNGTDSLLLDFKMSPSMAAGQNGQIVRLMVLSSRLPAARNVARGTAMAPVDPTTVTVGRGDNAMHDYQIDFVRVKTTATSPWRQGQAGADYRTPLLAATLPTGTSINLEYRGADDATGSNPSMWSAQIDVADGRPWIQYRVTLIGNPASGEVPSLDTLVIPY